MKKRLQVVLTSESWAAVEQVASRAANGFNVGTITYSDVVNEMILVAKVDIDILRAKHTDVRRSLRSLAAKDSVDLDSAIKNLTELRNKTSRRRPTNVVKEPS